MKKFKNILITRTDRIGDVVLATPVIEQIKSAYPDAKISFLTTPYTIDLLIGNPDLSEVIVYDKKKSEKNFWGGIIKFSLKLRSKKFDAVFVLHPTNRMHLVTFLAGIPVRIGWNIKYGNLLTHKLDHIKHQGQKHEAEYNLELLKILNIKTWQPKLSLPYEYISKSISFDTLAKYKLSPNKKYIVFALGASCLSKQWPIELFAELANKISELKPDLSIVVMGSANEKSLSDKFIALYKGECIDLCGRLSLKEVVFFIKHVCAFIGNDSGLSHIAASFDRPLISLFGRSDPGLSPTRWSPLGKKSVFIHKNVDCIKCLAHNCEKEFHCIRAILVDEVIEEVKKMLGI